ncbi:MAG: hydantoinase B/oxoprolinase family protein [Acidimicrobiia bacterium]|nr:hydantoinase B/oxoprolinase family protein [Acidimicrobiia bacterium]
MTTTTRAHEVDPITTEVIRGAMETIAFEMAVHVSLTAVTPILNQSNERNASILDETGRLAAISVGVPQLMLTSRGPVSFALETYGRDGFAPGDIIAGNDPYHGGGHLPDWNVFSPVVCDGDLILFASIQCHHADTGGETPGGYCVSAMDVWAEGFRCPVIKLAEAGEEKEDLIYLLQTNNRVPTFTADLRAQMGAARHGAKRLTELVEEYGPETVRAAVDASIELTERRIREEIATWPDGTYEAESFIEHDTMGNQDVRVHCRATIDGERLILDYTGSDDRQFLTTNGTLANTRGMILSQLTTMFDPTIPKNDGLFSSFEMVIPENTCINPAPTRPVSAGTHHPGVEVSEALCLALSQAVPERCQPQIYKAAIPTIIFGTNPETGQFFVDHSVDSLATCSAARPSGDAWGGIPTAFGNLVLATAEVNESLLPHRQLSRDLMTDSGGAGRWRGQPGSRYVKEVTATSSVYTWVIGIRYPAKGVNGGGPGSRTRLVLRAGGEHEYEVDHTAFYIEHQPGEKIICDYAGGGGWGDPLDREPERVLDDVWDEFVSVEAAARDYGVVVTGSLEELDLDLDVDATADLRSRMREERTASA